jgi:hypothetical protein
MLGKTVMIPNKGYGRVALTDEEVENHMKELLEFNIRELNRIIVETKNSTIMAISQTEAIKLLFEKQGMACYTFLQSKLDEKIDKLKSTDSN